MLGCAVVESRPAARSDPGSDVVTPIDPVFRDVDASDGDALVAMMDATDAWPAVQTARAWIRDTTSAAAGAPRRVLDLGAGPGTFNAGTGDSGVGGGLPASIFFSGFTPS